MKTRVTNKKLTKIIDVEDKIQEITEQDVPRVSFQTLTHAQRQYKTQLQKYSTA